MGLLDLFSNAFSGAGNAIGGAAGGLASLFDQGQPQRGQRDFGGFLNDYFRGLVPHQPTQQEYAAMLPQMFGQQAPNGQMFANSDPNKAPQLGDNGAPLAHFDTMSGGIVPGDTASKVAGLYANLPPQLGVPALLQLANKFTDPKEGYTLNPGQTRFGPNNTALASNTDETYGEPMPLPNGAGSVRFGNRGGAKFVPVTQAPATRLEFGAPGTTPTNPYTGKAAGPMLGAWQTLTPADLGLPAGNVKPGTVIQRSPVGELIPKNFGDMKSAGAFQQDVDLAGADAGARAREALAVNNPVGPNGEAIGTLGRPEIDVTVPGYSTAAIKEAGGLTQGAVDQAAMEYALTGRLPSGMGLGSTGIGGLRKTAIQNRAAELNTGGNMAANAAQLKALQGSLAQQTKYADATERSVNNAEHGFNQVVTAFQGKVNTSNFPLVNAIKNAALYQLSPGDISALKAGLTEVSNEYSNVFARGGQVTNAVRNKADAIANGDLSIDDLKKVQAELQEQGKIIVQGARGQAQQIQGQFNGILSGKPGGSPGASAPGANRVIHFNDLPK